MESLSDNDRQSLIFPRNGIYLMPIAQHLLPFYGYMDENEILMQMLNKTTHEFWKKYREILLKYTLIPKRVVEVTPITLTKRVRLIKLQKMYEYIDVKFKIQNPDSEPDKQKLEVINLDYLLMYLVSKDIRGRQNSYIPNITEVLSPINRIPELNDLLVKYEDSIPQGLSSLTIDRVTLNEFLLQLKPFPLDRRLKAGDCDRIKKNLKQLLHVKDL